ncbi:hypothetical protein OMK68_06920 [Rhodococcus pyridinivorans]|uniref:hypothetical protein n=1 Tax=Rhodococcus pyridinivorans TaxID=103816 RepID=UPI002227EBDB|nr:hypothetical protein [Rhodococcus pyridinivorans]MCW3469386.1 hypothetical protein [Rhodococcus pyridinivorans]
MNSTHDTDRPQGPGAEPDTLSPTETSKKDRTALWASLTVFALTSLIVLFTYVRDLVRSLGDGIVTARVKFDDAAAAPVLSTPTGVDLQSASTTVIDVPTDALSPVSVGFLRAGEALQTLGYLAALALLSWIVVRFARGRLFDRGVIRLVWVTSIVAIATIFVPTIPRTLGTNMLIRDVDMNEVLSNAPLGPEFWYAYVFCMVISAVGVVLRIGSRMARDNEGLV